MVTWSTLQVIGDQTPDISFTQMLPKRFRRIAALSLLAAACLALPAGRRKFRLPRKWVPRGDVSAAAFYPQ